MEERSLLELYNILLEHYKKDGTFICNKIKDICVLKKITVKERNLLFKHFRTQKPTKRKYPEFYNHKLFLQNCKRDNPWFESPYCNFNAVTVRIKFIKAIIETLK